MGTRRMSLVSLRPKIITKIKRRRSTLDKYVLLKKLMLRQRSFERKSKQTARRKQLRAQSRKAVFRKRKEMALLCVLVILALVRARVADAKQACADSLCVSRAHLPRCANEGSCARASSCTVPDPP